MIVERRQTRAARYLRLLAREGIPVEHVTDVTSVPHVLRRHTVELLLLVVAAVTRDTETQVRTLSDLDECAVMVIADHLAAPDRVALLRLGAFDCVTADVDPRELRARVRRVLRQTRRLNRASDGLLIDRQERLVTHLGRQVRLSRVETKLLSLLLRHRGRFVPRDVILQKVWLTHLGYPVPTTSNVLNVALSGLRRKFSRAGLPCPVVSQRGLGVAYASRRHATALVEPLPESTLLAESA
ncbi:winged helix-turn-helix transcriptional regulator [Deinococcus pimensis]|uniref:winged helix-turn-helix transcriptional regulator n=1 Tax=Deinococcus pimensis TaxID=309888 RepID=UPI00146F9430|nr:winged helix-turn-helix domain-containing protein [Deinococcus pimensis]